MPERVQLRRTKGWRMPENTVSVARPHLFGNPWTLPELREEWQGLEEPTDADLRAAAVESFGDWMKGTFRCEGGYPATDELRGRLVGALLTLRGKNLACWCALPEPGKPDLCHAAVLLEIANPREERDHG